MKLKEILSTLQQLDPETEIIFYENKKYINVDYLMYGEVNLESEDSLKELLPLGSGYLSFYPEWNII